MRRWIVRAGLVLAAGAAGLAVTAGSASADSGLSGTVDHVSSTVHEVAGGSSHSSHSSSSHSSSSKSSVSNPSASKSSSSRVSSPRVTVRRTVARPVVRTVHRVAQPVVRVERTQAKPVVSHEAVVEQRAAAKKAAAVKQRAAVAQQVVRIDRVSKDLLHATAKLTPTSVEAAPVKASPIRLSPVHLDLPRVGLSTVLVPTVSGPLGVTLPPVDLGAAKLLSVGVQVGVPAVAVGLEPLAPGLGALTPPSTSVLPLVPALSVLAAETPSYGATLLARPAAGVLALPAQLPALDAVVAGSGSSDVTGRLAAHISSAVSLLTGLGAVGFGSGAGLVPDGAAGAAGPGLVIFALAAGTGLSGAGALRVVPTPGPAGTLGRLLRQPGFSPD